MSSKRTTILLAELAESFRMAMGALAAHKLRSALTLLGVLVGVFSIIVVMTAMRVMQSDIEAQMSQLGSQTFMIRKWPAMYMGGPEGFEKFWHMIVASKTRFRCNDVMIGYESTGPYAEPLAHYLMDKPVTVVQVNPLHTKRLKEVNDNSPLKTDDKDPRVIGDVLRLGHALSVVVPEGDAAYLRRLTNARERHVGERTALLNQLQQLVFLIFPEFRTVFNDVTVKTARHLLQRYTTPEAVAGLRSRVVEILFDDSGEAGKEMVAFTDVRRAVHDGQGFGFQFRQRAQHAFGLDRVRHVTGQRPLLQGGRACQGLAVDRDPHPSGQHDRPCSDVRVVRGGRHRPSSPRRLVGARHRHEQRRTR